MLLIVLAIFFIISAIVIISSIKNAMPVDEHFRPLKNIDKKTGRKTTKRKTAAKSMTFGSHKRSLA